MEAAVGQAGSSTRPEPGQTEPGRAVPFQEPGSEFRISLSSPRFSSPSLATVFIRLSLSNVSPSLSLFTTPFLPNLFVSPRPALFPVWLSRIGESTTYQLADRGPLKAQSHRMVPQTVE